MASLDRRPLVVLLALTVGVGLSGCEQESEDTTLSNGLLVLSGDVGSVRLTVREDDGARSRGIDLPDAATSWVSAGRTNVLLAVLVDGRTYVSDLGEDDPTWRLVEPVTLTDLPPEPPCSTGRGTRPATPTRSSGRTSPRAAGCARSWSIPASTRPSRSR